MGFSTLSSREKILIGSALGLGFLFAVWQFGFKGLSNAREQAQSRYDNAVRENQIVAEGITRLQQEGRLGGTQLAMTANDNDTNAVLDRAAIMALVRQFNIPVSQVQPDGEARFNLWLSGVDSNVLFNWLAATQKQYGDHILTAHVTKTQDQKIDAYIVFSLGGI